MPTRRGVRGGKKQKLGRNYAGNSANSRPANSNGPGQKTEDQKPVVGPRYQVFNTIEMKNDVAGNVNETNDAESFPFKVKVSNLPALYNIREFIAYFQSTFNIPITRIVTPEKNSPWLVVPVATKEEQDKMIRLLHNHVWKKKVLQATEFTESLKRKAEGEADDPEAKKIKVEVPAPTMEEEIISEHLILGNVPYEEQKRLKLLDVEVLSSKLHAFMCERNPDLAGWAEAMCEQNGGFIYKIEPLKPSPFLLGYRNKCKFRIAKNPEGKITVGFCSNENENKIIGVEPGDKFLHAPDSMKHLAKKFEEYIATTGKDPYDKKKKSGFWDHIVIRISSEGDLMLIVVMFHNHQTDEQISEIKKDLKNYFATGNGKECNVYSLYFQIMNDKPPVLQPEKLELLMGEPSFEENISGLKFHIGAFSNIHANSPAIENIYSSVIELAEPTKDMIVLDLCAGSGGIAFTVANKCEKVIAIECQQENVNDAQKTMKLNEIKNVEFIRGRIEEELSKALEKCGDKKILPIIDPPRQGVAQKVIVELRANERIKKFVYVCSNSKLGMKNFLDLCAPTGKKEGNVEFAGLPFLPVKVIPVDVAPYTANNTIVVLFERVDPSTFPPAKNPPPAPLEKIHTKKEPGKKTRRKFAGGRRLDGRNGQQGNPGNPGNSKNQINKGNQGNRTNNRMVRKPNPNNNRFGGPPVRRMNRPPLMNPINQRGPMFNQDRSNRFPPPLMGSISTAMNLVVAKYEKRIAELEQDNRAIKANLSMGFQPGLQQGGSNNFGNLNPNFQNQGAFTQQNQGPFTQQNQSPFGNYPNQNQGNYQNQNQGNFQNQNQGFSGNPWLSNQGNLGPSQPPSIFNSTATMGNMGNFGNSNTGNFGNLGNFGRPNQNFTRRNNSGGNANKRFGGGGGPKNKGGGNFRNKQGNKPRR